MHMKQPESSLGTCCRNHLAASLGPVNVLVLVFRFAVVPCSKAAAQSTKKVTLFLNVHQDKNDFVPALRIGWEKATIFTTSAFLTTEQLSITEMLVGKDVFFYVPLKTGLVSIKTRSTMALIRRFLKIS